jgi:hypothetical protein
LLTSTGNKNYCFVCNNRRCKGGGNLQCVRRDSRPSVLAGILDTYGGIRFVVTHRRDLKRHVRPDEILIIVPKLLVHEPITWSDIPGIARRIERAVDEWVEKFGRARNEPWVRECIAMYRLRKLELNKRALDLYSIVET